MTIAAWIIVTAVGLYTVTLLIGRFAGSNSITSDDLTDEQLQAIAERLDECPECLRTSQTIDEAIARSMAADRAEREQA